jgi:cardiolipin-specific phospholipase
LHAKFYGQVYALDLLGWGQSNSESLESWRKSHNISKMTLAGHSMGGYLSVAYTERYPQHVAKLILLSPVGVPQKVEDEDEKRISAMPFYIRTMIHGVRTLFNQGITPGSFLRSLPYSKSRSMVESYIVNRLPSITCEHERSIV